jgi:hypothetical protein
MFHRELSKIILTVSRVHTAPGCACCDKFTVNDHVCGTGPIALPQARRHSTGTMRV